MRDWLYWLATHLPDGIAWSQAAGSLLRGLGAAIEDVAAALDEDRAAALPPPSGRWAAAWASQVLAWPWAEATTVPLWRILSSDWDFALSDAATVAGYWGLECEVVQGDGEVWIALEGVAYFAAGDEVGGSLMDWTARSWAAYCWLASLLPVGIMARLAALEEV